MSSFVHMTREGKCLCSSIWLHKDETSVDTLFAASLVGLVLCEALSAIQHRAATSPHFHESAAGQDTTHPIIAPCAMWQIDSLRFRVGLYWLPMRQPCNKGAVGRNYSCTQMQDSFSEWKAPCWQEETVHLSCKQFSFACSMGRLKGLAVKVRVSDPLLYSFGSQ